MPHTGPTFTSFQMAARYMAVYIIRNKLPTRTQDTAKVAWQQAHTVFLSLYTAEEDIKYLNDALSLAVLPTFNHATIQDFFSTPIEKIDPPSDLDDASVTVTEEVSPIRPVIPTLILPQRVEEQQKSVPQRQRVRFTRDPTPRPVRADNPFAAGARTSAGAMMAGRQQQGFFSGATPRYSHNPAAPTSAMGYMGPIPGVPCIIPRLTATSAHHYTAFTVGAPTVTPRSGVYHLYAQPVNIRSEQLSEINLDHKNATAFIEIRLTIHWALLGFKEKNAEVINNIIKSFKARDTIEAGLSAVAAYLQGIQNVGVQDYSTSVSSMQNAVVCRVGGVITDLIDGKFQPRTAITL